MKTLVIIPARKGSKGIPGKNWKLLGGKPLIQYSIEVALELFPSEQICISTDAEEVVAIAESFGLKVPFVRPEILASDSASSRDVLLHALDFYKSKNREFDAVLLLQPTSPFRTVEQVKAALENFNLEVDMVVSVKESAANPYYNLKEESTDGFLVASKPGNFIRRQDCPKVYELNGAIYVINAEALQRLPISEFKKVKKIVMDDFTSVDLDTSFDWLVAEMLLNQRKRQ